MESTTKSMPQRLYAQCPRCGRIYYVVSATRLQRITSYDGDPHYLQCRCGTPASAFTPIDASAVPRACTVNPLYGAPVDAAALSVFEAEEDAQDGIDDRGFPILPAAPKEATGTTAGKHWGMKYAIGWSNPVDCPDHAILWHVLAHSNQVAIKEAIGYYRLDRVVGFWNRMKEVGKIREKPTIYSSRNGELFESGVRRTDEILEQFEANNEK